MCLINLVMGYFLRRSPYVFLGDCLEVEVELDADAMAVGAGVFTVGEAPDVVDAQNGENVVEADTCLHIRLVAHGHAWRVGREQEHARILGGIVLVAQAAPDASQGDHLAQSQPLDEWQAVHQDAVTPIGEVPGERLIVDKLHRFHQSKTLGLDGVREVNVGQE